MYFQFGSRDLFRIILKKKIQCNIRLFLVILLLCFVIIVIVRVYFEKQFHLK